MDDKRVTVITREEYQALIDSQRYLQELNKEILIQLERDRTAVHALYNLLRKCESCKHFKELSNMELTS